MEQPIPKTTILFRRERTKDFEVTAVFPEEPATAEGSEMTCYSHVGQHSACTVGWYYTTRPAKPSEYADLQKELESIGYNLDIKKRVTREMHEYRRRIARTLRLGYSKEQQPSTA